MLKKNIFYHKLNDISYSITVKQLAKKTKSMNDIIFERISKEIDFDSLQKEYDELKTSEEKHAADYEIAKLIEKHSLIVIDKLTDQEFKKLKTENTRELNKFWKNFGIQYFDDKIKSGESSLDDLDKEMVKGQITYEYMHRRLTKAEKDALSKKKTLERMYELSKLQLLSFKSQVGARLYQLEPFFQVNQIINQRFGFDENWSLAISILSTHENLIKKKLFDLKVSKEEIQKISKNKGLDSLLEKLSSLIEKKEKRNLSLTFYKTPAIRKIRNRLEHEGYIQNVTRKEVLGLLKDIKEFENELYPKKL